MCKRIKILILTGLLAFSVVAAPIDDAKRLYRDGDYAGAVEKLRKILRSRPKEIGRAHV